jgi:hypothetical protein
MSALERIGVCLMHGAVDVLRVRSVDILVSVTASNGGSRFTVDMTVSEAKAWRKGLSRAIRQAEAEEASK